MWKNENKKRCGYFYLHKKRLSLKNDDMSRFLNQI